MVVACGISGGLPAPFMLTMPAPFVLLMPAPFMLPVPALNLVNALYIER